MDFLKELFDEGALTFEQFSQKVTDRGYKVADLSTGNYVAKKKYEDEVSTRDTQIGDLTSQITTRDSDIKNLKKQLEDNGTDNETKISDLTAQLTKLQGDYKTAKSEFETKLSKQSYEYAVRDFANGQNFSSKAAKKSFITDMLNAQLQMQNETIIGATDFLNNYKTENEDSFVVENPAPAEPKPTFVQPTPPTPDNTNPFEKAFNFVGVR